MGKPNPIIQRMKAHRAALETRIADTRSLLASLESEAASLDKLMSPVLAAAPPRPRTRKAPITDTLLEPST